MVGVLAVALVGRMQLMHRAPPRHGTEAISLSKYSECLNKPGWVGWVKRKNCCRGLGPFAARSTSFTRFLQPWHVKTCKGKQSWKFMLSWKFMKSWEGKTAKLERRVFFWSARSPKDLIPKSLFPLPPGPSASYGQIYRVKPGLACPSLSIKVRGLKRVPK